MASAEDYANWIVQNQDKKGSPEFETVAAAYKIARAPKQQPVEPTLPEKIAGSAPVRFAIGAAEPVIGAAQMVANAVHPDVGNAVNDHLQRLEGMIQSGRRGDSSANAPDAGFDVARFGGNVLSPVNAGLAKVLPTATTTAGRAGAGSLAGAFGGATMPVTEQGDYWQRKGAQVGIGALGGGIAAPVLGKLTDALAPRVEALIAKFSRSKAELQGVRATMEADQAIEQALKDIGAKADDMGAEQINALRQQVLNSLKNGKMKDPAALMREQDFKAVGVDPTLGQLTRDSTQFARERNLRGVPGVGEPLQGRFDTQNQQLQQRISALRGDPSEPYQAGSKIVEALSGVDNTLKSGVNAAYEKARDHLGRAAPMDAAGFSKSANLALDDQMLGHYLPAEVRNILNDVSAGKIPFNVNTAVQIDSTLSAAQRAAGKGTPQSLAIGKVRDALNSAGIADNVGVDAKAAFDAARGAASQRFKLHEAIPALEAAANGEAPDRFVQQFVINGKVGEVTKLADILKRTNPEAFQEARAQIGDKITRAAFGENVAGDKLAAPERLSKALREIGTDKLKAFYSPEEIAQFKTLSRVAAYINSTPSSAAVNTSNNIGAITGLASRIPGIPAAVSIANALRNTINNASTVRSGVNAVVPETTAKLSKEQQKLLARALTAGAVGTGVALAPR